MQGDDCAPQYAGQVNHYGTAVKQAEVLARLAKRRSATLLPNADKPTPSQHLRASLII